MEAHAWETCKENVQPVKSGRSARGLGLGAHSATEPDAAKRLVEQEKAFEQNIAEIAGRNPQSRELLDAYALFFKWSRDSFPSSSSHAQVLLERVTAELKDSTELKNDTKFVKMWIEYADMARTPGEIFSFMQSNKIGEKVALFWIAWAFVAEKAENYKLTDQIFQKGLQKVATIKDKDRHDEALASRVKAEKELLSKRYQQFQRRLARHYLNLAEAAQGSEGQPPSQPPQASHSERVALGGLRSGDAVRQPSNENAPLRAQNSARTVSHTQSRPAPSSSSASVTAAFSGAASSSSSSSVKHNFQIFSDSPAPGQQTAAVRAANEGFQVFSDEAPQLVENPAWTQLAPQRAARKENEGRATKWNEGGLRTAGAVVPPSSAVPVAVSTVSVPAIPIFCDPDEEAPQAVESEAFDTAKSRGIRFDLDAGAAGKTTRGGLAAMQAPVATVDPLQRHKAPIAASAPVLAAPKAAPLPPPSQPQPKQQQHPQPQPQPKITPTPAAPAFSSFQVFADSPGGVGGGGSSSGGSCTAIAPTTAATTKTNAVAARTEQSELDALLGDLGILDAEDGTINTRLARQHIDALFLSPSQSPPPVVAASVRDPRPAMQPHSNTRLFTHFNTTADLSAIKESSNEHSHFNVSSLHFGGATPNPRQNPPF